MSYEPLHHKYRPQSFAQLVGQEAIATTLTNAIHTSRIAPAYLFTGPRGTGKTSSARILAKSLNCLSSDKPTSQPCGKCDVCQGITKGATLDVIEIDAASNTGVDNIREIIERAQFAPVQCRYKVYVVDECHMLSTQAFNALLKTLEEPPPHVVFVLATTDPQRVLPTIISRCQRFDFRRIPMDEMVSHLSSIAEKENISINPQAIYLIAQFSQGGLRDAESLLDQLSLLSGEVNADRVWDLVGSVNERDLLALIDAIASDNAEVLLEGTRNILDRGREPLIVLQNLAAFYRDLLIAKTAPLRGDLVNCTQQTWQSLITEAQQLSINNILVGQEHLRSAEVQLKNTTVPRLWLEITLLGLLPSAHNSQIITPTNSVINSSIKSPRDSQVVPKRDSTAVANKLATSKSTTITPEIEQKINTSSISTANPVEKSPEHTSQVTPQGITQTSQKAVSPTPTESQSATSRQETQENINSSNNSLNNSLTNSSTNSHDSSDINSDVDSDNASQSINLDSIWHEVIQSLPIPARSLLSQHGSLLEMSETTATVVFPPNLVKIAQGKLSEVEIAFAKVRQQTIKVKFKPIQPQAKNTSNSNTNNSNTNNSNTSNSLNIKNNVKADSQPTANPASKNQQSQPVSNNQPSNNNLTSTPPRDQAPQHSAKPTTAVPENTLQKKSTHVSEKPPRNQSPSISKASNTKTSSNPEAEKVERSAQSLANFFDGEIVTSFLASESQEDIEF